MDTPYSVAVSLATAGPLSVSASAISAGDNFVNGRDEELGLVNAWASAASLCRFGNLEIARSLSLSLFFFSTFHGRMGKRREKPLALNS